jgi:hypothetical protein
MRQTVAKDAPTRNLLRRVWTGWIGLTYGLGIARLLYETDPRRFAVLGALWPSLGTGLAGLLLCLGLSWWPGRRLTSPSWGWSLPTLLPWLYVLTPPLDVNPLRGLILLIGGAALALVLSVPPRDDHRSPAQAGTLAVALLVLAAYLLTLQRTVGRADTFEFQVTAPVLGVAHPTGYPLYVLLGKVFSLLPLGKVATRVNLTSVVSATAAVTLIYLTLRRALRVGGMVAALAALAFGLSPIFWSQAVVAEVYALHNAFAAAMLGGALWLLAPPGDGHVQRLIPALFALAGLSLTNHLTTVLLLPALALAVLLAWPRLAWQRWALGIGLFMAALLIYAYIPLRWPALHDGRTMPFDEFLGWITGSRFGGALQLRAWLDDPERWRILGRLIRDQFGWPGVVLGGAGLALLALRRWRAALVTVVAFAAQAFYGLNYLVPDIGVFLIPMFLIQATWIGYGLHTIIEWIDQRLPDPLPDWGRAAVVTAFALIPLSAAWTVGPRFDWTTEHDLEAWGRHVLSLPLDEGSVILADSEKIAPLEYLHRIEGLRPDMSMVVLGTEEEYRAYLHAALAEGRTVYLQRFLPGLEGAYHLRSAGPLVEVGTESLTTTPGLRGEPLAWESGITLLGYRPEGREARVGEEAAITLYWQAADTIPDNYQVRLRLVDEAGEVIWQGAPAYAVGSRYPSVAWKAGEIIPDYHALPLSYTLRPGDYIIQAALSPPFSQDIAPLAGGEVWAEIAPLVVKPVQQPPPIAGRRLAVSASDGALTGIDVPEQVPMGSDLPVTVSYATKSGMTWIERSFSTEGGSPAPIAGDLSLAFDRERGALVASGRPMRCGWLRPPGESCIVSTVRIEGEAVAQAVANFDNKILLTGVDFEAGRLEPGQLVDVTLHWQALRTLDEDYTVFVHLLGPDGLLHGQVDSWPVQGTLPTSTWQPGQRIDDRYLVPLDADAPPGSYQLEIGVYLLSTNTRLPVLGPEGIPLDDRVLLGGLIVPEPEP